MSSLSIARAVVYAVVGFCAGTTGAHYATRWGWISGAPGHVITVADASDTAVEHMIYPGSFATRDTDRLVQKNMDRAVPCPCGRQPCANAEYLVRADAPNKVFRNVHVLPPGERDVLYYPLPREEATATDQE